MPNPKLNKLYALYKDEHPDILGGMDENSFVTKFSDTAKLGKLFDLTNETDPDILGGLKREDYINKFGDPPSSQANDYFSGQAKQMIQPVVGVLAPKENIPSNKEAPVEIQDYTKDTATGESYVNEDRANLQNKLDLLNKHINDPSYPDSSKKDFIKQADNLNIYLQRTKPRAVIFTPDDNPLDFGMGAIPNSTERQKQGWKENVERTNYDLGVEAINKSEEQLNTNYEELKNLVAKKRNEDPATSKTLSNYFSDLSSFNAMMEGSDGTKYTPEQKQQFANQFKDKWNDLLSDPAIDELLTSSIEFGSKINSARKELIKGTPNYQKYLFDNSVEQLKKETTDYSNPINLASFLKDAFVRDGIATTGEDLGAAAETYFGFGHKVREYFRKVQEKNTTASRFDRSMIEDYINDGQYDYVIDKDKNGKPQLQYVVDPKTGNKVEVILNEEQQAFIKNNEEKTQPRRVWKSILSQGFGELLQELPGIGLSMVSSGGMGIILKGAKAAELAGDANKIQKGINYLTGLNGGAKTIKNVASAATEFASGSIEGTASSRDQAYQLGLRGGEVTAWVAAQQAATGLADAINPMEIAWKDNPAFVHFKKKAADYAAGKISKTDLFKETGAGIFWDISKNQIKESFSEAIVEPVVQNLGHDVSDAVTGVDTKESRNVIDKKSMETAFWGSLVASGGFGLASGLRIRKDPLMQSAISYSINNPEAFQGYVEGLAKGGPEHAERAQFFAQTIEQAKDAKLGENDKVKAAALIFDRQSASLEAEQLAQKYGPTAPLVEAKQKEVNDLSLQLSDLLSKQYDIADNEETSAVEVATADAAPDNGATGAAISKKVFTDFDNTLFDPKTGQLTALGIEMKDRIANGEDVDILTAREDTPENRKLIADKLGIDPAKIQMGLTPEGKAAALKAHDGEKVFYDDNKDNLAAAQGTGAEVVDTGKGVEPAPIEKPKPTEKEAVVGQNKPVSLPAQKEESPSVIPEPKPEEKEDKAPDQEQKAKEHKDSIVKKFSEEFGSKGIPKKQIDAALVLMDARAKSWASEKPGRNPDEWYDRIADVKSGEFEKAVKPTEEEKSIVPDLGNAEGDNLVGDKLLESIDKNDENYDSIENAVSGKKFIKQKVKIKDLISKDKDLKEYLDNNKETKGRKIEKPIIVGDISRGGETQKGGVIDGFHRIAQAIANGETEIDAYVDQSPSTPEVKEPEGDRISSFNVGDIIEKSGKKYKILGNSKGKNEGVVKLESISDDPKENGTVSEWNAENNGGFNKAEEGNKPSPEAKGDVIETAKEIAGESTVDKLLKEGYTIERGKFDREAHASFFGLQTGVLVDKWEAAGLKLVKPAPKPKSDATLSLEKDLDDAQKELKSAKDKLKAKREKLTKAKQDDAEDLFGERKSNDQNKLVDERAAGDIEKLLEQEKRDVAASEKKVDKLKTKLEESKSTEKPTLFDEPVNEANSNIDGIVDEVKNILPPVEKKEVKKEAKPKTPEQPKISPIIEKDSKKNAINKVEDLQDVGEKIGGAKKDLAQMLSEVTTEDLETKPLGKVFPKPDFKKLVEEGSLSEDGAILLNFLYEKIPTKPRKKYRIPSWIKTVQGALDTTMQVLESESTKNLDFTKKILHAVTLSETLKRDYKLYSDTMKGLGFPKEHVNLGGYQIKKFENQSKWNKVTQKLEPVEGTIYSIVSGSSIVGDFKSMDDAINGLKQLLNKSEDKTKGTKFGIYQDRKTKELFIGKKGAFDVVRIMQGFETIKEARDFLKNKQAELQSIWDGMKANPKERRNANRQRVGVDWRKGKNITSDEFAKEFGFRGVEFGNWVNNAERQSHVNEAYEALMDLASVLGVTPKSLSLNGELGFAFGARGSGKFNAHYESGKVVINLTKTRGAGSLAHEWWHALDNYFSRNRGQKDSFITERPFDRVNSDGTRNEGVRKEMIDAFKSVMDAIRLSKLEKRSRELDKTRSDAYWSTAIEMSARSFENFIIQKLGERNNQNDYLANFKETSEWISGAGKDMDALKNYPYPLENESASINEAFQQFFDAIQEKTNADGKQVLFQKTDEDITLPDNRQVKVKPIQVDVVNGFYSPLEKTITEFKGDRLPAKQWAEKFKGEEAKWTGLIDWLNQQKGSVSKADIQQFLKDNRIQVVEVVKSEPEDAGYDDFQKQVEKAEKKYGVYINIDENPMDGSPIIDISGDKLDDMTDEEVQQLQDRVTNFVMAKAPNTENNTKFSSYQTEGEKSNYKELLVTMPIKSFSDWLKEKNKTFSEENKAEYESKYGSIKNNDRYFKSSHFEESNILVHLRMNTRTDAEGKKVLFLEEVQSDWGQKGKREGFTNTDFTDVDDKRLKELNAKFEKEGLSPEESNEEINLRRKQKGISLVPAAPFVTDTNSWTKLALKVALKEAVKQGADKIAWTTGEQQNDRYSLEKQVDEISYLETKEKGIYDVKATKENKEIFADNKMDLKKIEATLGKDMAEKIRNGVGEVKRGITFISGKDLKIGGKGMKGFYGSPTEGSLGILGNVAKSLFKQEVGTVEIKSGNGSVTESDARKGTPLTKAEAKEFYYNNTGTKNGYLYAIKENGQVERLDTLADINNTSPYDNLVKVTPKENYTQHSIDITPELKASVEQGQPLFQKDAEGNPKGAVESLDNGRKVIVAYPGADFSTIVHELAHIFEGDLTEAELKTMQEIGGSESFAESFETYIYTGEAPTPKLKALFSKFKKWLADIYKSIKGSPIEGKLNPDVKQIFDRLLTEAEDKNIKPEPTPKPKPVPVKEVPLPANIKQVPEKSIDQSPVVYVQGHRWFSKKVGTFYEEKTPPIEEKTPTFEEVKATPKEVKTTTVRKGTRKVNRKIKNKSYLLALSHVIEDADDLVIKAFIEGAKVKTDVLREIFESPKKKAPKELQIRLGLRDEEIGFKNIRALAHSIWEDQDVEFGYEKFTDQEIMSAVETVITQHISVGKMVETINNKYAEKEDLFRNPNEVSTEEKPVEEKPQEQPKTGNEGWDKLTQEEKDSGDFDENGIFIRFQKIAIDPNTSESLAEQQHKKKCK